MSHDDNDAGGDDMMHDDDEENDGDGKAHIFSQLGNT